MSAGVTLRFWYSDFLLGYPKAKFKLIDIFTGYRSCEVEVLVLVPIVVPRFINFGKKLRKSRYQIEVPPIFSRGTSIFYVKTEILVPRLVPRLQGRQKCWMHCSATAKVQCSAVLDWFALELHCSLSLSNFLSWWLIFFTYSADIFTIKWLFLLDFVAVL